MTRQVLFVIKEKNVLNDGNDDLFEGKQIGNNFLFFKDALSAAKDHLKAIGKVGSSYIEGESEDFQTTRIRLYGDANYLMTIEEVDA